MQIFGADSAGYRWAEAADNALLSVATTNNVAAAVVGSASCSSVIGGQVVTTLPPDYEETIRRTRSMRREPVGAATNTQLSDGRIVDVINLIRLT